MEETILEHVRRRLDEHKGDWPQIARDTGLDYSTVCRIGAGNSTNPELQSVQKIIDWCVARDAMLAKLKAEAA